jgi:hypothetical protein
MPANAVGMAQSLRALARRLDRLRPLNHEPEKYFEDRDEIRRELERLADAVSPAGVSRNNARAKFEAADVYARGRVVKVSRRHPHSLPDNRRPGPL